MRLLVVAAHAQGQQPEVRHLPHQQKERERKDGTVEYTPGTHPADSRWNRADHGSDHRGQRADPFQIGVDPVVPKHGQHAEPGGHDAAQEVERAQADQRQNGGPCHRADRRNLARWNRTKACAIHHRVPLVFLCLVERARGASQEQDRARGWHKPPGQGMRERQVARRGRHRRHDRDGELEKLGEIASAHEITSPSVSDHRSSKCESLHVAPSFKMSDNRPQVNWPRARR